MYQVYLIGSSCINSPLALQALFCHNFSLAEFSSYYRPRDEEGDESLSTISTFEFSPTRSKMLNLYAIPFVWLTRSLFASASITKPIICTFSSASQNTTLAQSCEVLCKPAKWIDLAVFYIGNYIAHVATLRTAPGQGAFEGLAMMIYTLLFPSIGLGEGIRAIISLASLERTPLRAAAKAGALYMVVKDYNHNKSDDRCDTNANIQKPEDARIQSHGNTKNQKPSDAKANAEGQNQGDQIKSVSNVLSDSAASLDALNIQSGGPESHDKCPATIPPAQQRNTKEQHYTSLQKGRLVFGTEKLFPKTIHGRVSLPLGWMLDSVPYNAAFADEQDESTFALSGQSLPPKPTSYINVGQDYSFIKALIAAAQALYAISTLYNTSVYAVNQFGYVAFGFTVIPFAFMSLVNLLANIACPTYPAIYIVENNVLETLRRRIASENKQMTFYVEGTVGRLKESYERQAQLKNAERAGLRRGLKGLLVSLLAVLMLIGAVVGSMGGLTDFKKADSTLAQRVWIILWLVCGIWIGTVFGTVRVIDAVDRSVGGLSSQDRKRFDQGLPFFVAIFGVSALGAYVVVGQMILQTGICERI